MKNGNFNLSIDWAEYNRQIDSIDPALRYELESLRKPDQSSVFWTMVDFAIDKIFQSSGIVCYEIRQKYQRKSVIIQSNWNGIELFSIN